MGNMKFVAELMKLTNDVEERRAGLRIAAAIGETDHRGVRAAKSLLSKLVANKPTVFDDVEHFNESEMDLMMTIVSLNGSTQELVEASDVEQPMTKPKVTIRAPAEMKDPPELFDGLSSDVPRGRNAADQAFLTRLGPKFKTWRFLNCRPGLEGTIKPVIKVRVKRDTVVNKVRLWLLTVPKGALVTSKELRKRFGLNNGVVCSIIDNLREDGVLRRKRDINGNFKRGVYVCMGKACEAKIKRRLRGKHVS